MSIKTPRTTTSSPSRPATPTIEHAPETHGRTAPCRSCGHDPIDGGWTLVDSAGGFGPAMATIECPSCDELVGFSATHDWTEP